jgi:hypothetical protein
MAARIHRAGPFLRRRCGLLGVLIAVLLGAVLRLVWVEDIEYKADEQWTFEHATNVGRGEPWPQRGMPSSTNLDHPGLSLWLFVLLARTFAVEEPTQLARAVQVLDITAIVLLLAFVLWAVPAEEREAWLWAVALLSVNPFMVLFQRKLWLPSILPLFSLLFLLGWFNRRSRWGGFLWGLLGACLGQIQLAGFFFAAGFLLWAVLFDRRGVAWGSWLAGSCLGVVPMLPWLHYLVTAGGRQAAPPRAWRNLLTPRFWLMWLSEPFGLGLDYTLGPHFDAFLAFPSLGGQPTYLVGVLHLPLLAGYVLTLLRAVRLCWRRRRRLVQRWIGRESPTAFTLAAAWWGFGGLLTLSTLPVYRHYLLLLFPLEFVWLARLVLPDKEEGAASLKLRRTALVCLCVAEFLLSVCLLGYLHVNGGAPGGDYGTAYSVQEPVR